MATFTCISCRVAFKDPDIQRLHYKSDWHRYNLKRKVAELPPVTSEDFQQRVLQQKVIDKEDAQEKSVFCKVCRKQFGTEKAFVNHQNSKKHKDNEIHAKGDSNVELVASVFKRDNVSFSSSDSEIEDVDSDQWDEDTENPIDSNNCLFCTHHSHDMVKNLKHMTVAHSFFIPDIEYCTDLLGLLSYLGEKISRGFMCLWCNDKGRTFYSADAAQKHMIDKGHCKMLHEGLTLAEYADFYDYSKSYPDADAEAVDINEEVEVSELDGTDYQLVLPSGIVVGHRSLMRYYKQSLDPNRIVAISRNTRKLHKVLANYRALGWTATQQEAAAKKARDIHYMKRQHAKWSMKLGIKANKLQPHFRTQINF